MLYIGRVERMTAKGAHITVRALSGRFVYKDVPIVQNVTTGGLLIGPPDPSVSGAGGDGHTHTIGHDHPVAQDALDVGDRVLVGQVEDRENRLVILGRLV